MSLKSTFFRIIWAALKIIASLYLFNKDRIVHKFSSLDRRSPYLPSTNRSLSVRKAYHASCTVLRLKSHFPCLPASWCGKSMIWNSIEWGYTPLAQSRRRWPNFCSHAKFVCLQNNRPSLAREISYNPPIFVNSHFIWNLSLILRDLFEFW